MTNELSSVWTCSSGHENPGSFTACQVCFEPTRHKVAQKASPASTRSSTDKMLASLASESPWVTLFVGLMLIGGCFAITNAVGITNTDKDDDDPSPAVTYPTDSSRAWLSPDGTGENCAWFPGVASDYGDPFTFCDYPAP